MANALSGAQIQTSTQVLSGPPSGAQQLASDTEFLLDVYQFQFKGLVLMQSLKGWTDKIQFRNAVHEFLKRDGASIERMGRKAAEFSFSCFFLGPNWRRQYDNLIAALSEDNTGTLVHPLLGEMPAACDVITSSVTVASGRNLVEFTLQITENRVDVLLAQRESTPAALKAAVDDSTQVLAAQAQDVPTSTAKITTYIAAVSAYAASAEVAASSFLVTASLPSLLNAAGVAAEAAELAVLATTGGDDAAVFDILEQIELGYAAALALDDAVRAQVPQPVFRSIIVSQPLITQCQQWYGGRDAEAMAEIIEAAYPTLNPLWLPQGIQLQIPPPTVPGA